MCDDLRIVCHVKTFTILNSREKTSVDNASFYTYNSAVFNIYSHVYPSADSFIRLFVRDSVVYVPCWVALQYAELPSLSDRRDKVCRFFPQIA